MKRGLNFLALLLAVASCETADGPGISSSGTATPTVVTSAQPSASTSSMPEVSTTASASVSLALSLPSTYFTNGTYVYLEGMVNRSAEVRIDELSLETQSISQGVSFWKEFEVTDAVTEVLVEAEVDGETLQKTVTIRYDAAYVEQLAYVTGVDLEAMTVTADFVEMLHGDEALLAAREDGEIGTEEELHGDFYIRNQNPRLREFPLASAIEPVLHGCYDNGPCLVQRPVDLSTWADLRLEYQTGDPTRDGWFWYGGGHLPYTLIFDGDDLVQVTEFYLP